MAIEDYVKEFEATSVNYNKDAMHMDFFLMLNDETADQYPGYLPHCGPDCTHHKLRIVSNAN